MDMPPKFAKRVANNVWFVFFVYFLAVAAWYAISGSDFVSSRWTTVAEARKRGRRHLLIVSLPMVYMVVYVYYQAMSGDYKEVCLTLVAFVFAASHVLEHFLGLWQLHIFREWTVRSVCSLESLGNRTLQSRWEGGTESSRARYSAKRRERALSISEKILINDTIVDSMISKGVVQCYLRFFTPNQKRDISGSKWSLMRVLLTVFYTAKNTVCIGGIVWPLLFSRLPSYSAPETTPLLHPREPEELWLRWSTVLISCAFPNWATDIRKMCSDEDGIQVSDFQLRRDRFAAAILRSAALHCERDRSSTSSSGLPYRHFSKFPKLRGGIFCKQEFLRYACTTGNGLPFQAPHKHATFGAGEDPVYSYKKYQTKLELARAALPANEGEKLRCLGVEELEWLAIFLTVEDWNIGTMDEGSDDGNLSDVNQPNYDPTDIAVMNLRRQLGLENLWKAARNRLPCRFRTGETEGRFGATGMCWR